MLEKKQVIIKTYSRYSECETNLKEFIENITMNIPDNYLDSAVIDIDGSDIEVEVSYRREETDEECFERTKEENMWLW